MPFATNTGRAPLSSRIDAETENRIRNLYLAGATMADIGAEVGEAEGDVYRFVEPRRLRWMRDSDFERRAIERGHIVIWRNISRRTGGSQVRPITLPGTSIQRRAITEDAR